MAGHGKQYGTQARVGYGVPWECVVRALVTHSRPNPLIKKNISFGGGPAYKLQI